MQGVILLAEELLASQERLLHGVGHWWENNIKCMWKKFVCEGAVWIHLHDDRP